MSLAESDLEVIFWALTTPPDNAKKKHTFSKIKAKMFFNPVDFL